jgi:hypothetical protein
MKKNHQLFIVSLLISLTVSGQKEGLITITKNDLKAYMTFFASDELQGRETGTLANEEAALYIKTNIMRMGLKPVPETGDYFQEMPLVSTKIVKKETYLKVTDSNGDPVFSTDSLVSLMVPAKTLDATGNVVFAGYGYDNKNTGYDDLKDLDLKNKIVLMMTRNPEMVAKDSAKSMFENNLESQKVMKVFSKGPKAILYVYDPKNKFHDAYASGLTGMVGSGNVSLKGQTGFSPPLQFAFITRYAADMLLRTTGYNLEQMQEKISTTGKATSMELPGITASLKTGVVTTELFSPNVIGIVEGSDPLLKNECVIYTAHFDHVGVNEKGEVFNGADDDASGSMVLLEVAQAFMNLWKKPLRSIVFVWVNGEEKGLLGSHYYANNPVIPMEKTLLDINLDMVGRSKMPSDTGKIMGFTLTVTQPGEVLAYTAHESSELIKMMLSSAQTAGVKVIDKGKDLEFGSSDHASFLAKGVPAFLFISGIHSDLHSTRDKVCKIDFDKMEEVSKMVFLLGYKVANQRERIKLDNLK